MKRLKTFGALAALFWSLAVFRLWAAEPSWYTVPEVIDGESFRLSGGAVVACASLRAPDAQNPSEAIRAYAKESAEFNRALIQGHKVRLESGSKIRDAKGRHLAYVYLEDGTFVNRRLLEEGYAKLAIELPNLEHADELRKAAAAARRDGRGLWRHEKNAPSRGVVYIGDEMTHIYHTPDCPLLKYVAQGHRRAFVSEVDASAADFKYCSECKRQESQRTGLF